jgi:DNA polymerase III, gamma/tau subunits
LLKLIEEPPSKTLFILIAEDEDKIISTIRSRCQILDIPKLSEDAIAQGLVLKANLSISKASSIAQQANGVF